ncbi:MAG TPA: chemotaxis protein CheW [Ktedonobacteraceae bacterium]|nr:chemotaxis protein CheW [Ktedonobacteraceae bacterium]
MFTPIWACLLTRKMAFQDEKDAQSLERMTDEEFWQRARVEAANASTPLSPSENAGLHQYLACELRRGTCYVPLHAIEAVIPASFSLARLPFAPRWVYGVLAWRGEIAAVVNLDEYLSELEMPFSGGMLLIARHPQCAIGLLVPAIGLTTTIGSEQLTSATAPSTLYAPARADVVQGLYDGYPVLDAVALLNDVTRQIGMAAHHD